MSELLERLEREVLPLVARPSRYTGGEKNVPVCDPAGADLSFLLAFPDVYEIGMSHLGIRILYDILNRRPDIAAERTFAPWTDMEAQMREKGVPLFSIENHRAAREFDPEYKQQTRSAATGPAQERGYQACGGERSVPTVGVRDS